MSHPDTNGEGQVRPLGTALFMHTGELVEATQLVKQHHYSGRWPSGAQVVATWHEPGGLFGDSGPAIAACVFGTPAARWSEPVLALVRLVRHPDAQVALSGLVAETVRYIKRKAVADLLVSFADATEGHHGGIYQACSWNYDGQRAPAMDGVIVNGQFVPGRSANGIWGTRSPTLLAKSGNDAEPHYDLGKHLYWRPVTREGSRQAKAIGLTSEPYPKPAAA